MDKGQSELTDKIRSAIKKKLIEINAFVDDELPDYIMILVANKRSKAHMEKDLTLFLGKDTVEFTNWLWQLVNNLKVSSKTKQNGKELKSADEPVKKEHSDEDVDVLDYDLGEHECDLEQDENSLDSRPLLTERTSVSKSDVQTSASRESVLTKNADIKKASPKAKVYPVQAVARVNPSSKSKPVSQKVYREDEYDPMKPEFTGNVSSIVRVSQRNYPRPALQASKLLLRAVDDATKSVLDGKSINDYYKPTPINVLSNKRETSVSSGLNNPVNRKVYSRVDLNSGFNIKYVEPSNFSENSNDSNINNILENEHYFLSQTSNTNRAISLSTLNTDLDIDDQTSYVEEKSNTPHFIVTLDGVDLSSFKRKFSDSSDESMEVDEEGLFPTNVDVSDTAVAKKQKIIERCKYWPACKNSDNCAYHHPTITCKSFPDCKYGDKCLFIHPNCKFDSLCTRKDCPFTHASKRTFQPQPVVPVKVRKPKIICKFYPKCTVKHCPFIHPKLCRYGAKCRLSVCPYSHFNIPSRSQLKWKADASLNL
ncbi:unnamed protein product [Larinioides sclopetarius]|uniref:Zinc finger CCCH domain-containing protein 14 n=1 Tax=Larinioides sclopetarius TaxID=280406 RepID=A0AAV1ZBN8_9ARAC